MNFINNLPHDVLVYAVATVLFPVEWYFAKPVVQRVYNDALYYINPIISKFGKTAPAQLP